MAVLASGMTGLLGAPLDFLLVRKIGAPDHDKYGIGAMIDGANPRWSSTR